MTQGRDSVLSPNEKTLDDINQDQSFPEHSTQKIWTIFAVLQLLLFVACVDQTSVNTSVPELVQALGDADTIGWVGTSFLIARCSSQMIPARFSDIFGRKVMLTVIIVIYMFANVLGGYARDSIWLFTARGVAGVGNGGINSLCMIVLADVVPLKDSAQYQGLLSMSIGLGNGLGPLIGGALSDASWRWVFWASPIIFSSLLIPLWVVLPSNTLEGDFMVKVKKFDYLGSVLSMTGSILFLIPISGGGTLYPWTSPLVVTMLVTGVVVIAAFLFVQDRAGDNALLPLRIFRYRTVALIFAITLMQGWAYYGQIFYLPIYFQEVRGESKTMSGILLLPMVLAQPLVGALCGQVASRTGSIVPQLRFGFTFWVIGCGLLHALKAHTNLTFQIVALLIVGIAVGMTLQTVTVIAQAGAPSKDRAIVTGIRNTGLTLGGAIGLAACGNIRNTVVRRQLTLMTDIPRSVARKVVVSGIASARGELDSETYEQVLAAVMSGLHGVFSSFIPLVAGAMILSFCIENHRLSEGRASRPNKDEEAVASS